MNHRALWCLWMVAPVCVAALHYGPGQRLLARDTAREHLALAERAADADDVERALAELDAARNSVPPDDADARVRIEIAAAKLMLSSGDLIGAAGALEPLLDSELAADNPRPAVVSVLRATLAETSYYTAWVMRLEGGSEDEWKPEAERARQYYRLLSEIATNQTDAMLMKENLEATIRLEQMDLSELKAKPLPKQCKCQGNCCQQKREQRLSQSKGKGGKPEDNRKQINSNSASEAVNRGKGS
ncbi:MAG: hypothetical protein ACK4WH_04665 [Phycisphaerales bacterium]